MSEKNKVKVDYWKVDAEIGGKDWADVKTLVENELVSIQFFNIKDK